MLARGRRLAVQDCTPGYFNNEGLDPGPIGSFFAGHPQGPMGYFRHVRDWREAGDFKGLELS